MKIAIVGDSVSTRGDAPFDDPSWEIWGIGTGFHLRRCSRLFEIHDPAFAVAYEDALYCELMRQVPTRFPDAILYRHPAEQKMWTTGNVIDFPHGQVLDYWADHGMPRDRSLLTSSIAWVMAYALMLSDVESIGLWGIDMDGRSEFGSQRTGGELWVGVARGRGIEVVLPRASLLCHTPYLYGIEDDRNREAIERIDDRAEVIRLEREHTAKDDQLARIGIMQMLTRDAELALWESKLPAEEVAERRVYIAAEKAKWEGELEKTQEHTREMDVRADENEWQRTNRTIALPGAPVTS